MARGSPSRRTQISATASALSRVEREVATDGPGALDEEGDRFLGRQRVEVDQPVEIGEAQGRHRVFVLAVDVKWAAAGRDDPEARCPGEQLGHGLGAADEVLEIVEDDGDAPVADMLHESIDRSQTAAVRQAHAGRGDRQDEIGLGDRRQLDEPDTTRKRIEAARRHLEGQPCLAGAAGSAERHEALSLEQLDASRRSRVRGR